MKYIFFVMLTFFFFQVPLLGMADMKKAENMMRHFQFKEAVKEYTIDANEGNLLAQTCLCDLYSTGMMGKKKKKEGVLWCIKAAEQGFAPAQAKLSKIYEAGVVGKKDYEAAKKWLTLATEQGYSPAQVQLGKKYGTGKSFLEKNYEKAHKWIELAANQGDLDATDFLSVYYEYGYGVPKDPVKSLMWFEITLALMEKDWNPKGTEKVRSKKRSKLTPEQITAAQDMAKDWVLNFRKEVISK